MTIKTKADIERLIPAKDFATAINRTVRTIRRWMTLGIDGKKLVGTRFGGRWYFSPEDVEAFKVRSRDDDGDAHDVPDDRDHAPNGSAT